MTDVAVAMHTQQHVAAGFDGTHVVDEVVVAEQARVLGDLAVARFDLDRLVKQAGRERQRMVEAVVALDDPLADGVVGQVAIVARRDVLMTRLDPRVVHGLHHVAVRARGRIVLEIGRAVAVAKREESKAA